MLCEVEVSVSEVWFSGVTITRGSVKFLWFQCTQSPTVSYFEWFILFFLGPLRSLVRPIEIYSRLMFVGQIRLMTFAGMLLYYFFQQIYHLQQYLDVHEFHVVLPNHANRLIWKAPITKLTTGKIVCPFVSEIKTQVDKCIEQHGGCWQSLSPIWDTKAICYTKHFR